MNFEEKFNFLVERLYQSGLEPGGWSYFLKSYGQLFPHSKSALATIEFGSNAKIARGVCNYSTESIQHYNQYYTDKNPFAADKTGTPPSGIYWGQELVSKEELLSTEFYQDFLRKEEDAWDGFGVGFYQSNQTRLYLTNNTNDRYEQAFAEQFVLVEQLLPHLKRAAEIHSRLEQKDAENLTLNSLLDRFTAPLFILNSGAQLIQHNLAADEVLRNGELLVVDGTGALKFKDSVNSRVFREQLHTAANPSICRTSQSYFRLRLSEDRLYAGLLFPLYQAHGETDLGIQPQLPVSFALLLSDPSRSRKLRPEYLMTTMAITNAEAKLGQALMNGLSVNEFAEQNEISKHTVRTQVKSLASKLDCSRQGEIVSKLNNVFSFGIADENDEK